MDLIGVSFQKRMEKPWQLRENNETKPASEDVIPINILCFPLFMLVAGGHPDPIDYSRLRPWTLLGHNHGPPTVTVVCMDLTIVLSQIMRFSSGRGLLRLSHIYVQGFPPLLGSAFLGTGIQRLPEKQHLCRSCSRIASISDPINDVFSK